MFSPVGNAIFLVAICYSIFALTRLWKRNRDHVMRTVRVTGISLVVLAAFGFWIWNGMLAYGPDRDDINGDLWNMSSSLFAALAFVGVVLGVWYQHKQLLDAQNGLKEQGKQIDRQNFETTFFHLLGTYANVVANFRYEAGKAKWTGQEAIEKFLSRVDDEYSGNIGFQRPECVTPLDHFRKIYGEVYADNYGMSGSYFRTIHTILRHLDRLSLPDGEKRDYAKILRAQMTDLEATFLAFNYLSNNTTDRFNPLILRYRMLKNADLDERKSMVELLCFIDPEAFGSRKAHEKRNITPIQIPKPDNVEFNQY